MRHKIGTLVPLEVAILEASTELRRAGQAEVHGYELAKVVRDLRQARRLTAYGTLYKALARLRARAASPVAGRTRSPPPKKGGHDVGSIA